MQTAFVMTWTTALERMTTAEYATARARSTTAAVLTLLKATATAMATSSTPLAYAVVLAQWTQMKTAFVTTWTTASAPMTTAACALGTTHHALVAQTKPRVIMTLPTCSRQPMKSR